MYEVELKVRADHESVRERLSARDAESRGSVVQTDTYFDAPHRDFAATDEALRIRRERDATAAAEGDETAVLTYKGELVETESKTREEIETGLGDAGDGTAILEAVGFEPAATVRKERERYAIDEFTVTLDDVRDVGTFVEVETETAAEADVPAKREAAKELLRDLDLDPAEQVRTSYLGLLLSDG